MKSASRFGAIAGDFVEVEVLLERVRGQLYDREVFEEMPVNRT